MARRARGPLTPAMAKRPRRFASATEPRLGELAAAVRVAEQLPPRRRRVAQRAIDGELARLETQLMTQLGAGS